MQDSLEQLPYQRQITFVPCDNRSIHERSKIILTVQNKINVIENLLFQTYASISDDFRKLSILLKSWQRVPTQGKQFNRFSDSPLPQSKVLYKWQSMCFMLAHFMQSKNMLPQLSKFDMEKLYKDICFDSCNEILNYNSSPQSTWIKLPHLFL